MAPLWMAILHFFSTPHRPRRQSHPNLFLSGPKLHFNCKLHNYLREFCRRRGSQEAAKGCPDAPRSFSLCAEAPRNLPEPRVRERAWAPLSRALLCQFFGGSDPLVGATVPHAVEAGKRLGWPKL